MPSLYNRPPSTDLPQIPRTLSSCLTHLAMYVRLEITIANESSLRDIKRAKSTISKTAKQPLRSGTLPQTQAHQRCHVVFGKATAPVPDTSVEPTTAPETIRFDRLAVENPKTDDNSKANDNSNDNSKADDTSDSSESMNSVLPASISAETPDMSSNDSFTASSP